MPGERVRLLINRNGKTRIVVVEIGEQVELERSDRINLIHC